MRFRGRLIGSRTYTYSPSTNPTVRVLIFVPLLFVASYPPRVPARPPLPLPDRVSFRENAVSRGEHNEIWNTSLTHWKRVSVNVAHKTPTANRKCDAPRPRRGPRIMPSAISRLSIIVDRLRAKSVAEWRDGGGRTGGRARSRNRSVSRESRRLVARNCDCGSRGNARNDVETRLLACRVALCARRRE